jgi:radical SAM superfamily enzyme YgiQ (UPF0313 family)
MRVLLVSTYDLGRQPFGLASPAAWLRRAGVEVDCLDTSREAPDEARLATADLIGFYLPMHTATRLAAPLIERARQRNPRARLCAFGLYAPLNAEWLRARGIDLVLGPESEAALVQAALDVSGSNVPGPPGGQPTASPLPRLQFIRPDRSGLPALDKYASLIMPDGSRRIAGSTEATRGCKHLCRHCPIVPIYNGQFRVVPVDVVIDDVRAQVEEGAQHITFGDPDFFNGPSHALRIVDALAREWPKLTYDVTIKVEHLLSHAPLLPRLRETGCLFVTSAVESIDDDVLAHLQKGHTRADFVRAVQRCRDAGLTLVPTFVPFHPWTTTAGYVELLDVIEELGLVAHVAPIQLAIRLLITAQSPLLDLDAVRARTTVFDPASLTWPWTHADPDVDALQQQVMATASEHVHAPRQQAFDAIATLARHAAGAPPRRVAFRRLTAVPAISEPWYCCAEPMENF